MKDQFKNVVVKGVHASRYIVSWVKVGGSLKYDVYGDFAEWLISLGLSNEECADICHLASNGRLELETSAKAYLKKVQTSK